MSSVEKYSRVVGAVSMKTVVSDHVERMMRNLWESIRGLQGGFLAKLRQRRRHRLSGSSGNNHPDWRLQRHPISFLVKRHHQREVGDNSPPNVEEMELRILSDLRVGAKQKVHHECRDSTGSSFLVFLKDARTSYQEASQLNEVP